MNEPLVSVIVPAYNYEQYVAKCITSLISQSYKKLEIIIIDDGSTDSTPQIVDSFAEKDKRIIVKHKANGGIGSAIKCGLELAHGEFIAFLDSDDWMDVSAYENLVKAANSTNADIVMSGVRMINLDGEIRGISVEKNETITGSAEIMKDYVCFHTVTPLSRKFCRRRLFDSLEMLDFSVGIDETISIQLISKSEKVVKINEHYYNVLGGPDKDSVSRRAIDGKCIDELIRTHQEIIGYFVKRKLPYLDYYILRFLGILMNMHVTVHKLEKNYDKEMVLQRTFKENYKQFTDSDAYRSLPLRRKISLQSFKIMPRTFSVMRGIGFQRE